MNPAGATYATIVHHTDEKKVLNDDCCAVILCGLHGRRSVERVRDEGLLAWAIESLCMLFAFCVEEMHIVQHKQ